MNEVMKLFCVLDEQEAWAIFILFWMNEYESLFLFLLFALVHILV